MANQVAGKDNTTNISQHIPQNQGQPRPAAMNHIPQFARKNPFGSGFNQFQQHFGQNLATQFRQ